MKIEMGDMIRKSRADMGLTQDQFAKQYDISGPAIFKFEKNYVKPSLNLWLLMAKDMKISNKEAVVMWIKAKLPKKYQDFVTLQTVDTKKGAKKGAKKATKPPTAEAARKAILSNRGAPKGLKELLKDKDIWTLYKPKAEEIEILHESFGNLGKGSKSAFCEALRLIREFKKT